MSKLSASAAILALLALVPACVAGAEEALDLGAEDTAATTASVTGAPALTFTSTWTQTASQPLFAGQAITVAYDTARLASSCGGAAYSAGGNGGFAWGITGYYAVGGAVPAQFPVTTSVAPKRRCLRARCFENSHAVCSKIGNEELAAGKNHGRRSLQPVKEAAAKLTKLGSACVRCNDVI